MDTTRMKYFNYHPVISHVYNNNTMTDSILADTKYGFRSFLSISEATNKCPTEKTYHSDEYLVLLLLHVSFSCICLCKYCISFEKSSRVLFIRVNIGKIICAQTE